MSVSLKKHVLKLLAATLAVSFAATIGAAALDAPVAVLSSKLNTRVGTVLTADEINSAEQVLSKMQAEAAAKAKAEAEAKAKAEAEAAKKAAEQAAYEQLLTEPVAAKTVAYSADLAVTDVIKSNATALGNYKLSFYCPCATCNGRSDAKTAAGTTMQEGRTIAVDTSIIPLGSRVYIDGYGVFVAEDTGSAIRNKKIDICVASHDRAYEIGIKYADVYLLG